MESLPVVKVLLIGGTSHVGKSTLARRLAQDLGWSHLSTDQLARHPGRPWRSGKDGVPADVVEHYTNLSTADLLASVRRHYQDNVWPIVAALVRSHLNNPYEPCLVFEGSAILPELVASAAWRRTRWLWLTAPAEVIDERIRHSSDYHRRAETERSLIRKFLERTLAFDRLVVRSAREVEAGLQDATAPDCYESISRMVRVS